jgi:hypothetical protein
MSKRRHNGDGTVDKRGENVWRLRYRINGQRFSTTFHGTRPDAQKELRRLLRTGDTGEHVAPDKITLGQWIDQWLSIGAPGRKRKPVGGRALQRYRQLLRVHVLPALGSRRLQQLKPTEIDALYRNLEGRVAPATAQYVHVVLGSCFATAIRKGLLDAADRAQH